MPRAPEVLKEEVIARAPVRTGKLKNVVVVTQKAAAAGNFFRRPYSWR